MADEIRIEHPDPERVVKRAFWLAWQAAGRAVGMGVLRDRPQAAEDDVWANVRNRGDYPANPDGVKPGDAYGDYVFGRMLKLGLKWDATAVLVTDRRPADPDYNAWARKYADAEAVVRAAVASLAQEQQPA